MAHIETEGESVKWTTFQQPHRPQRDYSAFGPFIFDADRYRRTVAALRDEFSIGKRLASASWPDESVPLKSHFGQGETELPHTADHTFGKLECNPQRFRLLFAHGRRTWIYGSATDVWQDLLYVLQLPSP